MMGPGRWVLFPGDQGRGTGEDDPDGANTPTMLESGVKPRDDLSYLTA